MLYQDKTFRRETVSLDGNQYIGCHFVECKLLFTAFDAVSVDRCTFTNCEWVVDGPAKIALLYLSALYHGLGPQGEELVEAIFENIRRGRVEEDIALPALSRTVAIR